MLVCIERRTQNQIALEASLHGIKLPIRDNIETISEDNIDDISFDDSLAEKAMLEAIKRKKSWNK